MSVSVSPFYEPVIVPYSVVATTHNYSSTMGRIALTTPHLWGAGSAFTHLGLLLGEKKKRRLLHLLFYTILCDPFFSTLMRFSEVYPLPRTVG